jgi:hypothetical protein
MQPRSFASLWIALLLCCAPSVVWAEAAPPEGSKPLTEILRPIETRPDFAYFEEVELEDGKVQNRVLHKGRIKAEDRGGSADRDAEPTCAGSLTSA